MEYLYHSYQDRIDLSDPMKKGILFWVYLKVNGNWDNNMIEFLNRNKSIVEQLLASEEK